MVTQEWVRNEIREALQEMVRAAEMRIQHDTDRIEDAASKAVEDCANAAIKEREAVWASAEADSPKAPTLADWGRASAQSVPGACVCRPWTVVDGRGKYLELGDNMSKVRGWDRRAGCPQHPLEGGPVCGAVSKSGNLRCELEVHGSSTRHVNGTTSWPNRDRVTAEELLGAVSVVVEVPVQVNVKAFAELVGEVATEGNVRRVVWEVLKDSLVVGAVRVGKG